LQNVDKLYANIPRLRQFYANGYTGACVQPTNFCSNDCVYPGDANKDGEVNALDILYMGCSYNNTGAARSDKTGIFQPNNAVAWTQPNLINNLNRKHQDCNGDGIVTQSDIAVINNNFSQRNANYTNITYAPAGIALSLESNTPLLRNLDSVPQSFTATNIPVKIRLNGNINGQIQNFYGLSFTLELANDTEMQIFNTLSSNLLFGNTDTQFSSGLDPNIYLVQYKTKQTTFSGLNRKSIDVVITRKDGQNFTGNAMDLFAFKFRKGAIIYNQTTSFARFSKVRMIKNDGMILNYGAKDQRIVFTTSTTVLATENQTPLTFECFPNPAQTQFTLTKPSDNNAKLTVTDLAGRTVYTQLLTQNDSLIPCENWQNGVYLLVIEENGSRAVQKMAILH
jgi:hypothetical protein